MPTIEEFEEAVRRSFRYSCEESEIGLEEYDLKCVQQPDHVRKVAYYFSSWYHPANGPEGDGSEFIDLCDDTSAEWPNNQVRLLLDFLAFTDMPIDKMK